MPNMRRLIERAEREAQEAAEAISQLASNTRSGGDANECSNPLLDDVDEALDVFCAKQSDVLLLLLLPVAVLLWRYGPSFARIKGTFEYIKEHPKETFTAAFSAFGIYNSAPEFISDKMSDWLSRIGSAFVACSITSTSFDAAEVCSFVAGGLIAGLLYRLCRHECPIKKGALCFNLKEFDTTDLGFKTPPDQENKEHEKVLKYWVDKDVKVKYEERTVEVLGMLKRTNPGRAYFGGDLSPAGPADLLRQAIGQQGADEYPIPKEAKFVRFAYPLDGIQDALLYLQQDTETRKQFEDECARYRPLAFAVMGGFVFFDTNGKICTQLLCLRPPGDDPAQLPPDLTVHDPTSVRHQ